MSEKIALGGVSGSVTHERCKSAQWQHGNGSTFPYSLFCSCLTEAIAKLAFCVTATHEELATFLGPFMLQTDEGQEGYGNRIKVISQQL